MTTFYNKPSMQINGFISDKVSPDWKKVQLCLSQKDDTKRIILNLKDVFFLLSSPCNFVSLALLNNYKIFYDNKNKTLYNLKTKKVFV